MRKKILIIGNNDNLPGVKVDIIKYKKFFMSSYGGNWLESEIIERLNISKSDLVKELAVLKSLHLDYLILIFSGHGGQERETVLELNPKEECISESDLKLLAVRQLNIFDCCRSYATPLMESIKGELKEKLFSTKNTREKYEKKIMQAVPQQISLYACSIGEAANDTRTGGVYSKYLIDSSISDESEYITVAEAHKIASILTTLDEPSQNPDAVLPKCLSSQQLIIGVMP